MKVNRKFIVLTTVAALAVASVVFLRNGKDSSVDIPKSDLVLKTRRAIASATNRPHASRVKIERGEHVRGKDTIGPEGALIDKDASESSIAKAVRLLNEYLQSEEFKALSKERQQVVHMRLALDGGDRRLAMRYARDLMDSDDIGVRHSVLDAFGWIGRDALPELTEMMMDEDAIIAQEALEYWKDSFQEIPEEADRAKIIVDLIPTLTTQVECDSILMELTKMQTPTAMDAVVSIIEGTKGVGKECALEMYEHLTGGEIYEGVEQAEVITERMMRLQNGEDYKTVMKETGGEYTEKPSEEALNKANPAQGVNPPSP